MRVKILRVQADAFIRMQKRDPLGKPVVQLVDNPLPDDARVIRIGYDYTGWLQFVIESQSFPDLNDGDAMPDLPAPTFRLERREPNSPTDVKP